ncbi:hypothetical protein BDC45DRAFT_565546 [Circinella umbellata]|nr:hypothetical protein BDC45DRAFT_565546 [Circinella umbellata]
MTRISRYTEIISVIEPTLVTKRAFSKPVFKYQGPSKRKTIKIPSYFTFTPNEKVELSLSLFKSSSSEVVSSKLSTSRTSSNDTE